MNAHAITNRTSSAASARHFANPENPATYIHQIHGKASASQNAGRYANRKIPCISTNTHPPRNSASTSTTGDTARHVSGWRGGGKNCWKKRERAEGKARGVCGKTPPAHKARVWRSSAPAHKNLRYQRSRDICNVTTVLETGRAGQAWPDDEVLRYASGENRVLLTLNRKDFFRLHRAQPGHGGIVACTVDIDFPGQARRIHAALIAAGEMCGQLIRVNRLAGGSNQ